MTQRAADDYVAIKQALEQIEREKAAALDQAPQDFTIVTGDSIMESQKSVDEYLGMMGWMHWTPDDWAKYRTEAIAEPVTPRSDLLEWSHGDFVKLA